MEKELVAILGAGESGIGAALLAKKKGYDVLVSDYGTITQKYKNELISNKIPFEEKGHTIEIIANAAWIIKSPGIPSKAKFIQELKSLGKTVVSEIEFAFMFSDMKILAITGSNGKTTTASLCFHILKEAGLNVVLGGNIGTSFARILATDKAYDFAVLELSSFQLDDIVKFKADIAVLLNISADHLDRYDYDMEQYAMAKWRITKNQDKDCHFILNKEDEWTQLMINRVGSKSKLVWLSADYPISSLSSKELRHNLKGKHNDFNISVAISTAKLFGVEDDVILKALQSFKAIPHRLETIAIINGVEYINDSKATNVDAVYYALEAIPDNIIWIAGGTDKGNEYQDLKSIAASKIKCLICLGVDNTKLEKAFSTTVEKIISTDSMDAAVDAAFHHSEKGDTVLLSPACASFDLFNNYEHRGALFKEQVLKLID